MVVEDLLRAAEPAADCFALCVYKHFLRQHGGSMFVHG